MVRHRAFGLDRPLGLCPHDDAVPTLRRTSGRPRLAVLSAIMCALATGCDAFPLRLDTVYGAAAAPRRDDVGKDVPRVQVTPLTLLVAFGASGIPRMPRLATALPAPGDVPPLAGPLLLAAGLTAVATTLRRRPRI
jgi:hypothetical protein